MVAARTPKILQIRVDLEHSKPPIWRRLLVAEDTRLDVLHTIIQDAFGWYDTHLHVFVCGNRRFSHPEILEDCEDEASVTIGKLLKKKGDKLLYEYDFGDDWCHLIKLEEKRAATKVEPPLPRLIAGKRDAPPEDCGGIFGFMDLCGRFLQGKDVSDLLEHFGLTKDWDPAAFDVKEADLILRGEYPEAQQLEALFGECATLATPDTSITMSPWPAPEPVMPPFYSPLERRLAMQRLESWIGRASLREKSRRLMDTFFAPLYEIALDAKDIEHAREQEELLSLLSGWMYADSQLGNELCSALDVLAASKGDILPPGSRRFLDLFANSSTHIYQVLEVERERCCSLLDLFNNETLIVHEKLGTEHMFPGCLLAARVVPVSEDCLNFENLMLLPGDTDEALGWISEFLTLFALAGDDKQPFDLSDPSEALVFGKLLPPLIAALWFDFHYVGLDEDDGAVEEHDHELMPLIVNGEMLEQGYAEYLLPPDVDIPSAMNGIGGMHQGDPGCWVYTIEVADGWREIGSIEVQAAPKNQQLLLLNTLGRKSMKQLRDVLRSVFKRTMKHRFTEYAAPQLTTPGRGPLEIYQTPLDLAALGVEPDSPEFDAKVSFFVRSQHMEKWIDTEVPALDNITPRMAAQDPKMRSRLAELLDNMEQGDRDMAARDGSEPLDFSQLRQALFPVNP